MTKTLFVFLALMTILVAESQIDTISSDTLYILDKKKLNRVIYLKENCALHCLNQSGEKRWTIDLKYLSCNITCFKHYSKYTRHGIPIKGDSDVALRLADGRAYGIKSRNGKLTLLDRIPSLVCDFQ
jgi:hypothetical protein